MVMKDKKLFSDSTRIIISELVKDGRIKYTEIGKKLGITPAAAKERVERLINRKIIKISALLNTSEIFPLVFNIGIEADPEAVDLLIKKLKNCPLVFYMAKTSGNHNLILTIVSKDMHQADDFLNKQIRSEPGIRHVEINIGNNTVVPEFMQLQLTLNTEKNTAACGVKKDQPDVCFGCPCFD